jgi:hypothetical protein
MSPLADSDYCWAHDPANAEAAEEARRAGGSRRKRQGTIRVAYDVAGLGSVADIRRYAELAMDDTVSMDNGFQRNRLIFYGCQVASGLLKAGEFEERLKIVEAAVLANQGRSDSLYDQADDFDLSEDVG